MDILDYDFIAPGMKRGRVNDWQFLTRDARGLFYLWTVKPKIDADGEWCFKNEDLLNSKATCIPLPFIPEVLLPFRGLRGPKAVKIWEIDYKISPILRDYFKEEFNRENENDNDEVGATLLMEFFV